MNVIEVVAKLLKLDIISFTDFLRHAVDGERDAVDQQRFAVFDGKDDVVVGTVCIVVCFDDGHASYCIRKPRFPDLPTRSSRQSREEIRFAYYIK